jgi:hypothetical protein
MIRKTLPGTPITPKFSSPKAQAIIPLVRMLLFRFDSALFGLPHSEDQVFFVTRTKAKQTSGELGT